MLVKKLTNKIIEKIIAEFNEPENMDKMKKNIVDPLIRYTYRQLYPYFLVAIVLFLLTFILALLIFLILLPRNKKIISEKKARKLNPDFFLVTPWGFLNEFKKRETKWRKMGGKFIVPFPKMRIV